MPAFIKSSQLRIRSWLEAVYLLFVLCVSVECGGLPPVGSTDSPEWVKVVTEHFVVYSDESSEDTVRNAIYLERMLASYLRFGWESEGRPSGSVVVVIFDNTDHYREFATYGYAGHYITEILFEPMAITSQGFRRDMFRTLNHELTYFIQDIAIGNRPAWYTEGLATYFETARFDGEGRFVVGEVPRGRFNELKRYGLMPLSQLMSEETLPTTLGFYANAWLLVHYLMSERSDSFQRYQHYLMEGADFREALSEILEKKSLESLQLDLRAYGEDGKFASFRHSVPDITVETRVYSLNDADIYALRAALYLTCLKCATSSEQREKVRFNVRMALTKDPYHVAATILRRTMDESSLGFLTEARTLTKHHSDDWRSWVYLFHALAKSGSTYEEMKTAVDKAMLLDRDQSYVQLAAASLATQVGRWKAAIRHGQTALSGQPRNPSVLLQYGSILAQMGCCEELGNIHRRVTRGTYGARVDADSPLIAKQAKICSTVSSNKQSAQIDCASTIH